MSSNKNWGDGSIDWVASHEAYEEFVAEREAGHQAVVPKGEKKKKAKKAIKRAAEPGAGEPVKKKKKTEEKKVEEKKALERRHSV